MTIFYPFTPLTIQKIKILKKWKNHLEISFYAHVPEMTIMWCMVSAIWSMTDRIFCHFRQFFAHSPPKNRKNQNLGKNEKTPGDITILHKCTKNHYCMLYCSWDMAYDGCNCYFSFWAIFCPFTAQKIKISKKKKHLQMSSFYTCVPKIMIRWYIVPEKWCTIDGWTDRLKDGKSDT